jgi:hypothetical protein
MTKKIAIALVLAAVIMAMPYTVRAQVSNNQNAYNQYYADYYARYYYNYYSNPIFWPFLAAGAIIGTAALIATLPIRVVCADCLPPPARFYPLYVPPPPPSGPAMSYQQAH